MFLRSYISRVLVVAAAVAALACVSFADTLHLKDGSIIKGKIVSFNGGKFTVVMGEGSHRREMTFAASEVESIKFDEDSNVASNPANEPSRKYEPPKPSVQQEQPNNTTTAQQDQQKPRFKQWADTGQKPTVIVTDNTQQQSRQVGTTQKPAVIPPAQSQPRVINTSATVSQPGRPEAAAPAKQNSNAGMQPISWNVEVTADNRNNGWTNSGWVVRKGQKIRITGDGTVDLGKGNKSDPSGDPDIPDNQKLLKNVATGALIAVIGDDNNDFIYVGAERTFTATRDGALFMGINEGYLDDNTGSYKVKVEILPDDK